MVMNGVEVGDIIHGAVRARMFSLLGFSDAGPGQFGFLLDALGYGVTLPARRS
jgi:aspartyl-tRNA synthetase